MSATSPKLDEIKTLFSLEGRWQSWLDVEATLAKAQAELDMIPRSAAVEIMRQARLDAIDIEAMKIEIETAQAPILAMVHALANACDGDAGHFVHWGGTTQNIILTARILQIRKTHNAILSSMAGCFDAMARLAEDGADMIMAGRTNGQHALPITFGFKVAGWIEEFTRFEDRFHEIEPRIFSLVFGGAIGAMQAFGDKGPHLVEIMGTQLNLKPVLVPTRSMVDHVVEYIMLLSLFGTSCSRISKEVFSLMSEEIGEVSEDLGDDVIGSSTMPQKINPKISVSIIAAANRLQGYLYPALQAAQPSHEGDAATSQTHYAMIDGACPLAYQIILDTEKLLSCLRPIPKRMSQNLAASNGLINAENAMFHLATVHGRQKAHDLVHDAVIMARSKDILLVDALVELDLVADKESEQALRDSLKPENYTGQSAAIARKSVAMAREAAARLRA